MVYFAKTRAQFKEYFDKAKLPNKIGLMKFYKNPRFPGHNEPIEEHLIQLEQKYNVEEEKLIIIQANAAQFYNIAGVMGLSQYPSYVFIKDSEIVLPLPRPSPEKLADEVEKLFAEMSTKKQ